MAKTTKKKTGKTKTSKKAPKETSKKTEVSKRGPMKKGTWFAKLSDDKAQWKLVDATNMPLGRLSSQVAQILMGKLSPTYTKHAATGDFVVVVNADKVALSGKKWEQKFYKWYTGYVGGVKEISAQDLRTKHPERLIQWAVEGMLPSNHVGRRWKKRLRIFAGAEHDHKAQNPQPVTLAAR